MRPFVLAVMILSVLAGCPVQDQSATPTASVETEADLGECTPDRSDASTTTTPATTAPAVLPTPQATATPTPTVPVAPSQASTTR